MNNSHHSLEAPAPFTRFNKETSLQIASQALMESYDDLLPSAKALPAMHGALRHAVGMEKTHAITQPQFECLPFFLRCTPPCWNNSSLLPQTSTSFIRINKETNLRITSKSLTESDNDLLSPSKALPRCIESLRHADGIKICILGNCPISARMPAVFPQMYLSMLEPF